MNGKFEVFSRLIVLEVDEGRTFRKCSLKFAKSSYTVGIALL